MKNPLRKSAHQSIAIFSQTIARYYSYPPTITRDPVFYHKMTNLYVPWVVLCGFLPNNEPHQLSTLAALVSWYVIWESSRGRISAILIAASDISAGMQNKTKRCSALAFCSPEHVLARIEERRYHVSRRILIVAVRASCSPSAFPLSFFLSLSFAM